MIVDGKKIAAALFEQVQSEVAGLATPPVLAAITCAPNFETKKYLDLKRRKAADVGIRLRVIELPETITTTEAIATINAILPDVHGVVVQLPFPQHIDREVLLAAIPVNKDPDGFSYGNESGACLPPVVGAIAAIANDHHISFAGKNVVVVGQGRLVGSPAALYAKERGATVTTLTETDQDKLSLLKDADILITGMGNPHFVTAAMVKEGVAVFDAGTSEDEGVVVGDVAPEVAKVAGLFTPVPGGIGPITIAVLLRNLVTLIQ